MQVCQVIVDVPTFQTNQPYSYRSDGVSHKLQVGMRVIVPFGKGNRLVQGIVVGFDEMDDVTELKSIAEVEDLLPVLNDEMLALADEMAEDTFSFKISCLQAMIPNAMKTSYEKWVVLTKEASVIEEAWINERLTLPEKYTTLERREDWKEWERFIRQNKLAIRYQPKKRASMKMTLQLRRLLSRESIQEMLESLPASYKKQRKLLRCLQELEDESYIDYLIWSKQYGFTRKDIRKAEDNGWLVTREVEAYRATYDQEKIQQTTALKLNDEQAHVKQTILEAMQTDTAQTFLLEGVTGSGKTEVYLQLIQEVVERGQTALMLVPEITLTPQMVERFVGRLGEQIAVLHSGISEGEQYDEWRRIKTGQAKVVIGARSAVFAPLENIGIIIIDEEHETSYKQDDVAPRYHARDVAIWRGNYHHCPVVLGSATPSLETRARALKGRYQTLKLTKRANPQATLPNVEVIDMTEVQKYNPNDVILSEPLKQALAKRLEQHEQSVLLLNRRGYSSYVLCRDCGNVLQCPNCDVSMTYHHDQQRMKCHYCGHEAHVTHNCPNCGSQKLSFNGYGTQKVESYLHELFPDMRILRMDVDTTRKKGAHEQILETFSNQEADVLLGTQMIAKGLDFPNVTLVGVLNADTSLNLPDFRSSERTFQLLMQVAGRAGRSDKPGEVYIQTYNPSHYAIQLAKLQDYERFFHYEMQVRHLGDYPPYYYTVQIVVSHEREIDAAMLIRELSQAIHEALEEEVIILGPTPKAITRLQNRYFYQMIIKYKSAPKLMTTLNKIVKDTQMSSRKGFNIVINKEPNQFM